MYGYFGHMRGFRLMCEINPSLSMVCGRLLNECADSKQTTVGKLQILQFSPYLGEEVPEWACPRDGSLRMIHWACGVLRRLSAEV